MTPSGAVDTLEGNDAIWRDLDSLEERGHMNLMRFKKTKAKIPHLARGNSQYQYRLGNEWIESSSAEGDLGILVNKKIGHLPAMCTCRPCQLYLGPHEKKCGQQIKGADSLSLCSTLVRLPCGVLHPALGLPTTRQTRSC